MSKQRKSFIIHNDSLNILDELTDEQAGKLFKAIQSYHTGELLEMDTLTKIAFSPFKNQFDRDLEKYEKLCEKNRLIAENRYGTKSTSGKSRNQPLPDSTKSTDNDSKSDSKNKSDNDSKNINKESNNLSTEVKPPRYSKDDLDCAEWFFSLLKKLNPEHKKPNFNAWADDIRKIINIDKRSYQEISDLMMWVNNDSFWQANILSPKKLREKWDALTIQKSKVRHNKTEARTLNNLTVGEDFLNEY